ncbi:MAG: acyl-ACP--UDP-N-acetylglucosamine O-acyltransferase [Prevotellaceae bacterium]|jgi:UDP-N-acetylglucosamine acyltransferase|nr:acyl-ACP--UDP-N-acetylglucosamine O-acyltransferase [Prevotellaceae bacterium]
MIHQTAIIHPSAKISENVIIKPYVTIGENVQIGAGTVIMTHASVVKNTKIGENNHIYHSAVVGGDPQDLKFHGEETFLEIGNNNKIREFVTINRGTASKGKTVIGNNCLIMAYCHVAHDCFLMDDIIMSNAVQLAGEIEIDDYAIISGGVLVHQFTKIGKHVIIQGGAHVNKDIPPFIMAARDPIQYSGINTVGLKRRNFTEEQIIEIQTIYRIIFQSGLIVSNAIERIETEIPNSDIKTEILNFVKSSDRGVLKGFS